MTNMDIEKTGQDLKNKDTRKHTAGTIAGGIVGGVIGGYPGMQIGMAIGGYLFKPDSSNKKDYVNPDYKISNIRLDSVPDVIGTDICPGKVIYFNKDTFRVFDGGHAIAPDMMPEESAKWNDFLDSLSKEKVAYWAEYAVNFCGRYYGDSHIGVVKFNGKPFWFWLLFSDQFENYADPLNPNAPLTTLDAAQLPPGGLFNRIDIEEAIGQDVDFNHIMYFKGFFADFSMVSVAPETSNMRLSLDVLADIKPEQLPARLSAMPIFTAEVNSDRVWLSPESMRDGAGMPNYASYYNNPGGVYDPDTYYNYGVSMDRYWGCRDAKNNNYVGVAGGYNYQTEQYEYFPIFLEGSERKWDYCLESYDRYDYYHDPEIPDVKDYFRENIISPSYSPDWDETKISTDRHYNTAISFLQCTDVIDDRVYICTYRNWINAGETEHHHVGYGVKFDIYYHDRSSPYQEVHSLLYDYQLDNQEGGEGCNPSLHFGSMQVSEDYIYIFGSRNQTDIVLTDRRTIEDEENSYFKVYCDLSQYPHNFWSNRYAALSQNNYKIWREITYQTSTYILVGKEFGAFPRPGATIKFSKYPQWVAEYGIVGAISEDRLTITIVAPPFDPDNWIDHAKIDRWDSLFPIGRWLYGTGISDIDGTETHLTEPIDDPFSIQVGDRVGYTVSSSTYFLDDIVDPKMNEYIDIFEDLGFNAWPAKDDLANLRASRISGNEFNRSHHCCWRIDKNTGAVVRFGGKRLTTPTYYVGANLTYTGGVKVYSCATDKQAFVYSHESQYGTQMAAYSYVIDFESQGRLESIHRRNNYSGGHTPAWCYMGCVSSKEWDEGLQEWVTVWYTICRVFDSHEGLRGGIGAGNYFIKLNDGKFSNKEVMSDNINGYYGLNTADMEILLYRPGISTGPLYNGMYINSFPDENEYSIVKFGITEDIYFFVLKNQGLAGTGIGAGPFELWRYTVPTEKDAAGELYCIAKSYLRDSETGESFNWLGIPYGLSYTKSCRYGFYNSNWNSGIWYQCDASPPQVISDFFQGYQDPSYIVPGDYLYWDFSEALEICNEIIDTTLYTIKENIPLKERRFQFSQCYDQPKRFDDVLNEVLDTCQGFLSVCAFERTIYQAFGRYKMIVPNSGERPVHYFGHDSAVLVSTQLSDIANYIYGNFSAYPDNYWKGDMVHFEVSGLGRDWGVIIEQTSTYIVMGDNLSNFFPDSTQFTLKKDNIKEGSFTFAEKSSMNRPNKVRIEFKNRLLGYVKDVAEAEDTYRLDVLNETEKIDQYKMHGIKRATQAGRMALRILDQWNHQKFVCAFETDVMGMTLCMGEIIGVSHDTTGWNGKWFRIVAMEELMDFEVRFELEEFNPYCYHDSGVPVFQGHPYSGFPTPYVPKNVERLEIKEDIEFNRLYFTFKEPLNDAGFFIGARVYRQTGTDTWEFLAIINETASSVKLAQDVGLNDTTIYYDNDFLYGSFPAQGVIWIEGELMHYHGIDTVNHAFTNVVRGYKDTDQVEHSLDDDDLYITLRNDVINDYLEIPEEWAGTTQIFKVSSTTIHFLTMALDLSPSVSIDIIGHGVLLLPYFPESIQNKLPEFESVFESLGLSEYTIELTIEQVVEILGLGDSKVVTETLKRFTESIGLGDSLRDVSIINIIESLGLGDFQYQPYYVNVIEAIGLGDSKAILESLTQLTETLGLGDLNYIIDYITETLGLGDSKIITETLAQLVEAISLDDTGTIVMDESIIESLGLGDITETGVIDYITETLGLGDSKVVTETLVQLIESLGLGDALSDYEQYPYSIPLTNPDAETGDTTGWTHSIGANFSVGTGANKAHTGTYGFTLSSNAVQSEVYQDYDLDEIINPDDIDSNKVGVTFDWWLNGYSPGDLDCMAMGVAFLNDSDVEICRSYSLWDERDLSWLAKTWTFYLPYGTRKLRILMMGWRNQGTELSAYIDDIEAEIIENPDPDIVHVYLKNFAAEDGTNDWTVETGSLGLKTSWNASSTIVKPYFFFGGAVATSEVYQRVNLSDYNISTTDIDSGNLNARIVCQVASYSSSDTVQLKIRYLNSSQVEISTTSGTAAAGPVYPSWSERELYDATVIPTNTRYIDVKVKMVRGAGSNNDGYWEAMYLTIEK